MSKEGEHHWQPSAIEEITKIAIEQTLRDGTHVPTLIVEGNQGTVLLQIEKPPPTHHERLVQMFSLGFALAQHEDVGALQHVFFITEAWMSIGVGKELPTQPPSQDPKRREVLLVSGYMPRSQAAEGALVEMLRDSAGRLVELRPLEPDAESQVESPLLVAFTEGFRRGAS